MESSFPSLKPKEAGSISSHSQPYLLPWFHLWIKSFEVESPNISDFIHSENVSVKYSLVVINTCTITRQQKLFLKQGDLPHLERRTRWVTSQWFGQNDIPVPTFLPTLRPQESFTKKQKLSAFFKACRSANHKSKIWLVQMDRIYIHQFNQDWLKLKFEESNGKRSEQTKIIFHQAGCCGWGFPY